MSAKVKKSEGSAARYATGNDLSVARAKARQRGHGLERIRRRREVDKLWAAVSDARADLDGLLNRPVLDSLNASWQVLDASYEGLIKRADKHHVAATPFEALFFYVEMGFYPPPELLLALCDMWGAYLNSAGTVPLETFFLGPAIKKAGNHAKRHQTWARYTYMGIRLDALQAEGHTAIKAAEMISEEFGGKPEPESILRLVNANYLLRKRIKRRSS